VHKDDPNTRYSLKVIIGVSDKCSRKDKESLKLIAKNIAAKLTLITGGLNWDFTNGTWLINNEIEHEH